MTTDLNIVSRTATNATAQSLPIPAAVRPHRLRAADAVCAGAGHPGRRLRRLHGRRDVVRGDPPSGLVSNGFSIADPDDAGMLDVAGFDAAAPALIADFIRQT